MRWLCGAGPLSTLSRSACSTARNQAGAFESGRWSPFGIGGVLMFAEVGYMRTCREPPTAGMQATRLGPRRAAFSLPPSLLCVRFTAFAVVPSATLTDCTRLGAGSGGPHVGGYVAATKWSRGGSLRGRPGFCRCPPSRRQTNKSVIVLRERLNNSLSTPKMYRKLLISYVTEFNC